MASAIGASASAQSAPAQLQIDLASHSMPGVPGLGALNRLSGMMGGGGPEYGMTRHPAMPGRYMDVALHNRAAPGKPAQQSVPRGLQLGQGIELLPQAAARSGTATAANDGGGMGGGGDGTYKVRYYWGCGEQARSGQPSNFTVTIRNGRPQQSGRMMQPRQVPGAGHEAGPQHVLWPNPSNRRSVSARSSLVGSHQLSGEGLPAGLQFELGAEHDFLPELQLSSDGSPAQGMTLRWSGADGARGYFIHAMATVGDSMVMWSSSEDGYAGTEMFDYLPESVVGQWVEKRTLLRPDTRQCTIPREVFADGGSPMVQMIAYGNDRSLRRPGLDVRVRSKATAMLMSGMDAGNNAGQDGAQRARREGARGLLRGLIGR